MRPAIPTVLIALLPFQQAVCAEQPTPAIQDNTSVQQHTLSAGGYELAELTGIWPLYERLRNEQEKARRQQTEDLRTTQRIVYLHAQITQSVQTIDCQLRRTIGKIDSDLADIGDLKALLVDQRSKVAHRTSMVNLVSGGATRIGAYSTALATTNTLPINIPEIFDGVTQIALSSLMVRQEYKEKRSSKLIPESVLNFLSMSNTPPRAYAQSVWAYLNHPIPGRSDGKSRRQLVIESWIGMGRVVANTPLSEPPGSSQRLLRPSKSTEDDLDISLAMMSDIKASLYSMDAGMADLSETLRASYSDDPPL